MTPVSLRACRVVPRLLQEFACKYVKAADKEVISPAYGLQMLLDFALLRRLCEQSGGVTSKPQDEFSSLASRVEDNVSHHFHYMGFPIYHPSILQLSSGIPAETSSKFILNKDTAIVQQLPRLQVLLGPLFDDEAWGSSSAAQNNAQTSLLPMGAPLAETGLPSTMDLLKPGPRFQLLSVGGATGR